MRIVGHGIDLVEVDRIRRMLAQHGPRFLDRCFTAREQHDSLGVKRQAEHLAARFAAKEAVLKAIGTGLTHGIFWTDVEVRKDHVGKPEIHLSGKAQMFAKHHKITDWLVSLTHTDRTAAASVIAISDPERS